MLETYNWAGYVVASDFTNPQPQVTNVSASWVVPTVTTNLSGTYYSAVWIGIGGLAYSPFNDNTLIQCGTEQDSIHGQPSYSAWYELLPSSTTTIAMTISPGDQMQAWIQFQNATANLWTINVTDTTTAKTFQINVTYASSRLSAEWIVERPSITTRGGSQLTSLANFGNATFTDCAASVGSIAGSINSFPVEELVMYAASGNTTIQLTDVSDLTPDGTTFTVTYLGFGINSLFSPRKNEKNCLSNLNETHLWQKTKRLEQKLLFSKIFSCRRMGTRSGRFGRFFCSWDKSSSKLRSLCNLTALTFGCSWKIAHTANKLTI